MQIRISPGQLLLGGVAVAALGTWLLRSNEQLEAATQQSPNTKSSFVTVGVDPKLGVDSGDPYEVIGSGKGPKDLEILKDSGAVRVKASSDSEKAAVYAVRLPDGAAICVANRGDQPALLKIGIRLTRGAYALERTILSQSSGDSLPQNSAPAGTLPQNWGPGGTETSAQVERLQSVYMDRTGWLWRTGKLEPNQAAIYRLTNRSAQVQDAYDSFASSMKKLRRSEPHHYRLLASDLRICEDNVAALSRGTPKAERFRMLRYIHRALLAVGQAQAFNRNAPEGKQVQESLDRFEDALAGLSAALLTLVPSLDVASGTDSQARKVTVKLTNCGEKSIENLRMGLQTPQGGKVWPGERAMFSSLKPGESARATFSVRFPEADSNPRVGAEITYFIANGPARLRIESGL